MNIKKILKEIIGKIKTSPQKSSQKIPFPTQQYQVIYADPPWQYKNKNTGGSLKSGASNHYQTMSFEELKSLDVPSICGRDTILFLWA